MSYTLSGNSLLSRLNRIFHAAAANLNTTEVLLKNPTRRKKPAATEMLKAKEERKIFKLNRELKKAQDADRVLKPIDECQLSISGEEIDKRKRPKAQLDEQQKEYRALLLKEWTRHQSMVYRAEQVKLTAIMKARQKALKTLKEESSFLYEEAIKPLEELHQTYQGPTQTPPIDNYFAPDGVYLSANRNWDVDPMPLSDKQRFKFSDAFAELEARRLNHEEKEKAKKTV